MLKGIFKLLFTLSLLLICNVSFAHTTQVVMQVNETAVEYYQIDNNLFALKIQAQEAQATLSSSEKTSFFELEAIEIEEEEEEEKQHAFKRFSSDCWNLILPFSFDPTNSLSCDTAAENASESVFHFQSKHHSLNAILQIFRI